MKCPKCKFNGNPTLEETGPHTKATCPDCGTYIKMVGSDELDAIIERSTNKPTNKEKDWIALETFVIKTDAPREYMPNILKQVSVSLNNGFLCGIGNVTKPFDTVLYHYEFYYK